MRARGGGDGGGDGGNEGGEEGGGGDGDGGGGDGDGGGGDGGGGLGGGGFGGGGGWWTGCAELCISVCDVSSGMRGLADATQTRAAATASRLADMGITHPGGPSQGPQTRQLYEYLPLS